jgi:lipoprotein NlpD
MRLSRWLAIALAVGLCASCATRRPAPVEDRAMQGPLPRMVEIPPAPPAPVGEAPVPTYTVKRGDTLYQIALDNGLDYRELAGWNNIENVNLIRVGQVLRLNAPGESAPAPAAAGVTTAPLRTAPPVAESRSASAAATPVASGMTKSAPKAIKEPYSEQVVRELTLAATARPAPPDVVAALPPRDVRTDAARPALPADGDEDRLGWTWPAKGKLIAGFSDTANLKGIDIAGTAGEPVVASAAGKVVYAGTGLRGYGKLIIIKHNQTYLSAYAHNNNLLVKEGQNVVKGQKIAEIGNTDSSQAKLHFEIRRQGKPIDPVKLLPERPS